MASTVTARAPAWADGVQVSGAEMRAAIGGGIWANAGVARGLVVVQIPTPAMQVRVPAGLAVVSDGQNGFVPLELATQTDLDIGASSPTLPRIDSVIAEFVDNGASSLYRFRIVAGTPNASPVQPTLPYADQPTGKTLRLYNVAVAALATTVVNANITLQAGTALLADAGRVQEVSSDGGRPAAVSTTTIWRSDKLCFETVISGTWYEHYVSTGGPAWTAYTPTWTGNTTNPVINNGTIVGAYKRSGKEIVFRAEITMGSTTTYGSGQYKISLPVAAKTTQTQFCNSHIFDTSTGFRWFGQAELSAGTTAALLTYIGTADGSYRTISSNQPITLATGDKLSIWGTYEAA